MSERAEGPPGGRAPLQASAVICSGGALGYRLEVRVQPSERPVCIERQTITGCCDALREVLLRER